MGLAGSLLLDTVPDGVLGFGAAYEINNLTRVQSNLKNLKTATIILEQGLKQYNCLKLLSESSAVKVGKVIGKITPYVSAVSTILSILMQLLEETEKLHKALGKLEQSIYQTNLEGFLKGWTFNLLTIQDPQTSDQQRIAELVVAVSNFNIALPIFTGDTVMNKKYFLGAPLFVQVYAIFKSITLIAKNVDGYNGKGVPFGALEKEYLDVLTSYKLRCVRGRLKDIECKPSNGPGNEKVEFKDQLTFEFSMYFGPHRKEECKMDLTAARSRLEFFVGDDSVMWDPWDPRPKSQMNFHPAPDGPNDRSRAKKALAQYRMEVVQKMELFLRLSVRTRFRKCCCHF